MSGVVIKQGIPGSPNPNAPGTIIIDSLNNALYTVGPNSNAQASSSVIASKLNAAQLTNITTAQTLFTQALNAGALNIVGRIVRLRGIAIFSTTAGNVGVPTLALTLGGVGLGSVTLGATNTAAFTNAQLEFEYLIGVVTAGATGQVVVGGDIFVQLGASSAAALSQYALPGAVISNVNLTTADTLALTMSSTVAIPTLKLQIATLELVA